MKLKRCPFCGDHMTISYSSYAHEYRIWHIHQNCKFMDPFIITTEHAGSLGDAARIWNTRPEVTKP